MRAARYAELEDEFEHESTEVETPVTEAQGSLTIPTIKAVEDGVLDHELEEDDAVVNPRYKQIKTNDSLISYVLFKDN